MIGLCRVSSTLYAGAVCGGRKFCCRDRLDRNIEPRQPHDLAGEAAPGRLAAIGHVVVDPPRAGETAPLVPNKYTIALATCGT